MTALSNIWTGRLELGLKLIENLLLSLVSDWNQPIITSLIFLLTKNEATLCCDQRPTSARYRTLREQFFRLTKITMLTIRLYICALTFLFLFLVIAHRGLGILEAVVITCAIVYLILDVRIDLQARKTELRLLDDLEKQVSALLR